jgi:hypothetical protein
MSAEKKFESLPKNVQKLVRKLAKVGREELALLQDNTKNDVTEEIGVLFEQEDKLIGELFNTKFAIETIGICFPDDFDSIDLEGMANICSACTPWTGCLRRKSRRNTARICSMPAPC